MKEVASVLHKSDKGVHVGDGEWEKDGGVTKRGVNVMLMLKVTLKYRLRWLSVNKMLVHYKGQLNVMLMLNVRLKHKLKWLIVK